LAKQQKPIQIREGDSAYHKKAFITILQLAYSGERAAARAYAGHWRSLPPGNERETIARIEKEEVEHRQTVGKMLQELNAKPALWREILMNFIGNCAYVGCFFTGWFLPMYFAGKLENDNVKEYDVAAAHAHALGLDHLLPALHEMSKTEAEHELFFSRCVSNHWLLKPVRAIVGWDPQIVLAKYAEEP
jgi:hypothetical protein